MIFKASPNIEKTNSIPIQRKPTGSTKPILNHSPRPHLPTSSIFRKQEQQQNAVRIDTCIVGDDTTCDVAQNEVCKTDLGVSSCHCRPGNCYLQKIILLYSCKSHWKKIENEINYNFGLNSN